MKSSTAVGHLGPRLQGRLTAELILRSPQSMNCIGLYHLDLRGNRIGAIENLGATQNQFDSIDLSDNTVVRLEGFPKLPRLKMVLLCNNRIASIAPGLHEQIPALDTLILTNNKLERLSDIDALASFKNLKRLSFLENPVSKNRDFRLYVIFKLPSVKVLDFRKVRDAEREAARKKYMDMTSEELRHASEQRPVTVVTNSNGADGAEVGQPSAPTKEQLTAIQAAIANATTLEEVHRLEAALKAGQVPKAADDEDGATAMEEN